MGGDAPILKMGSSIQGKFRQCHSCMHTKNNLCKWNAIESELNLNEILPSFIQQTTSPTKMEW